MSDIHELRGFEAYLESMLSAPHGVTLALLRARLDSLRPSVPFDLEPTPFDGRPIYTTTEMDRRLDLSERYAAVRKWHELSDKVAVLVEVVR